MSSNSVVVACYWSAVCNKSNRIMGKAPLFTPNGIRYSYALVDPEDQNKVALPLSIYEDSVLVYVYEAPVGAYGLPNLKVVQCEIYRNNSFLPADDEL